MNQPDVAAQINVSRERLDAASGALNALAADANRETLRNTASAVGSTLIATARDDVLWGVLSPEQSAGNLNAVERAQLRTVLTTNWVQTLEDLKYEPPPPADTYGTSFVQALGSLVNRDGGGDVAAVRQKVRELGQQLVALAALPPAKAPPSRLRKFLNRTKRVSAAWLLLPASR